MVRLGFFFKITLVFAPLAIILLLLTSRSGSQPAEFLTGIVTASRTESRKLYESTLINSYDPDLGWKPEMRYGTANQPEISGTAGILVEIDSGKILFEKDSTERRQIASLTKIMTAVVALEHKNLQDEIAVSVRAAMVGENNMGIGEGETYTLEELLYGLLLPSGNDAAYAIAEGVAGDKNTFVEWMNFKAEELGLQNTYFADPSGLDNDTYSTAEELVKLTRYALKNPKFREIVRTYETELSGPNHKYIFLQNQTNLLTTYPGVAGVKTGYTGRAGLTLVTYFDDYGYELIGVVLGSVDRRGDMILMLDHGLGSLGVVVEHDLLQY
jgi:serine-type D-Ala-D-Ala carboxypeptidase (penicillin-binding protein 5/6)